MGNFIYDLLGLPFPKTNNRPLKVPSGQGVAAVDWNQICQALADIQADANAWRYLGIQKQAGDPGPPNAPRYLWLAPNFQLYFNRGPGGGGTFLIPTVPTGAKGDLAVNDGTGAYSNLVVGADGKALVADAASPLGVKWATPPGGIGAHGDVLTFIVPAAARATHDTATPKVVGAFALDPTKYALAGTDQIPFFRALFASSNPAKTVHVKLVNLSDGEDVGGADLTTTSTATVKVDAGLAEGNNAGQIKDAEKIYEVRIWVANPGPGDTVELYGAELRMVKNVL